MNKEEIMHSVTEFIQIPTNLSIGGIKEFYFIPTNRLNNGLRTFNLVVSNGSMYSFVCNEFSKLLFTTKIKYMGVGMKYDIVSYHFDHIISIFNYGDTAIIAET